MSLNLAIIPRIHTEFLHSPLKIVPKEDITLIRKEKTNHGHLYRFFKDAWKRVEKFSLNFSSCNPFPSWPSADIYTC